MSSGYIDYPIKNEMINIPNNIDKFVALELTKEWIKSRPTTIRLNSDEITAIYLKFYNVVKGGE